MPVFRLRKTPFIDDYIGCAVALVRTGQLITHMQGFHPKLLGSTVNGEPNIIKPGRVPFPSRVEPPPPLPTGDRYLLDFDPLPVRSNKRKRVDSQPHSSARKWSRLDGQDTVSGEDDEPCPHDLDDLPQFDRSVKVVRDMVIQRRPTQKETSILSSAYRIVDPSPPDDGPPASILYDTFAEKVDNLVANRLL